jgi:hypothetical protein
MKHLIKNSLKYAFGIMPVTAILLMTNFKKSNDYLITSPASKTSTQLKVSKDETVNFLSALPCGFKSVGAFQLPERPTFLTNNSIPVLQYPAGNYPGTTLQIPDAVYSEKSNDQLILQADGNLVLYCTSCSPAKALWASETQGRGGQALFFQTDGELVLHNANGKTIWRSNIRSTCPGSELAYYTLQDDGNLAMLYNETLAVGQNVLPASPQANNDPNSKIVTVYLGGTATTNNQDKSPHSGRIH